MKNCSHPAVVMHFHLSLQDIIRKAGSFLRHGSSGKGNDLIFNSEDPCITKQFTLFFNDFYGEVFL